MRTVLAAIAALSALAVSAATTITHKAVDHFVADKRIRLEAAVADPQGIKLARAYFKTDTQADFLFVPMQAQLTAGGTWYAILPAPAKGVASINYVLLAVNKDGAVSRTEVYTAKRRDSDQAPSWQMVRADGELKVFTEIPNLPSPASAFSDSISMNVAESGARFGAVAGLYGAQGGGANSGVAGGEAGAAAAATTGITTAAIIGGVAIAGVAAAAAGSGGGSSGSSPTTPPPPSSSPYAGNWSGTYATTTASPLCTGATGNWQIAVASSGSFTGSLGNSSGSANISGTVSPTGQFGLAFSDSNSGTSTVCNGQGQFNLSPRSASGNFTCTTTFSGGSCALNGTMTGS